MGNSVTMKTNVKLPMHREIYLGEWTTMHGDIYLGARTNNYNYRFKFDKIKGSVIKHKCNDIEYVLMLLFFPLEQITKSGRWNHPNFFITSSECPHILDNHSQLIMRFMVPVYPNEH